MGRVACRGLTGGRGHVEARKVDRGHVETRKVNRGHVEAKKVDSAHGEDGKKKKLGRGHGGWKGS